MIYNLNNELDRARYARRAEALLARRGMVELTEKTPRSLNQNSYLHALLAAVAIETGNPLEYVKQEYYKKLVNPGLFVIHKADKYAGDVVTLRSSADLTVEEMTASIERLKKWAAEEGMYLPEPGDAELLQQIEYEAARMAKYL